MTTPSWSLDASPEGTELRTFVQWKGTDLCMDAWCVCGKHPHFDGCFTYQVRCDGCGQVYELSTRLLVRKVDVP
jgi:hypothetical protein